MKIKSPITGQRNTVLEQRVNPSFIVDLYKKELGINVGRFFKKIPRVGIYRCQDSGYRFYYPLNLDGDGKFYSQLQKVSWYYMDWKWEHEVIMNLIKKNDKVLEIGCAKGSFLAKIAPKCLRVVGLEKNIEAIKLAKKAGLTILDVDLDEYAVKNRNQFDLVCSFQVLEHIWNVRGFIQSSLGCLKKGGKLIVSVPNNECLIFKKFDIYLNMPPHHMGLWDIHSLVKLSHFFPMELDDIYLEPLQDYHKGFAQKLVGKPFFWFRPPAPVDILKDYIVGHTIIAVYTKK